MKNFQISLPLLIVSLLLFGVCLFFGTANRSKELNYSQFRNLVTSESSRVRSVEIEDTGGRAVAVLNDGSKVSTKLMRTLDGHPDLIKDLEASGISIDIKGSSGEMFSTIMSFLPALLIIPLLLMMFRGIQSGGGQAFNFIRSKAKLLSEQKVKVTFADVAGIDEAKNELTEVVDFLKDGEKFRALGAKIPKGVLLVGPPGTGKTLLAKAIAGEAGVPFFSISGSDFVEMFVGVGASRVRDLFEQARKQAPCIVFVDEIDAVGRQRGVMGFGGHDEREQTLNQLLVEMDGFETTTANVIILAATNRPDVLDSALTRPGRFDRQVVINYPDVRGREAILKVHAKGKVLDSEINLRTISKRTPGFTGAQLANVMNEAALIAATKSKKQIEMVDVDEAVDKVFLGTKRSLSMQYKDLELTAYHETGHALAAIYDEDATPLHKLTIVPRGMAGGVTWYLPDDDSQSVTRRMLLSRIKASLGGRAAEEIVYGDITTGAYADLQACTGIARRMVTQFGMSDLGPVAFAKERESFLGDFGSQREYSEEMAQKIDQRIQQIISECYREVLNLIGNKRAEMDAIVYELLERETLEADEVKQIIKRVEEQTYNFDTARAKVKALKDKLERERENASPPDVAAA